MWKIIQADKSHKKAQSIDTQSRSVVVRETNFALASDTQKLPIHDLYQALLENRDRSEIIAYDIMMAVNGGHYPLVLTERVEHLEKLEELLRCCPSPIVQLRGGMGKKQRLKAMEQLETCAGPRVILATGRYIGEGFDDSKLDTLFLALPISWTGTLQQYVGRLHREHKGKRIVTVYDYVDSQVPTLQRMFKKRLRGYKAFGYDVRKEVDVLLQN